MKRLIHFSTIVCLTLLYSQTLNSQVNGYAEVTAINGLSFAIGNDNESNDAFVAGEQVIIMQIQDNVIGNTSNSANFGNLGSISSAGLYEIRVIDYVVRTGPNLDSVVIIGPLSNAYNIGSNSSVQLITFPTLDDGGGDYSTTANITAPGWNGSLGGVIAFNVDGVLTLNHDVTANGDGFRGASPNGGGSTGCTPNGNFRVTSQGNFADKGEGIYKTTTANHAAGRGKILNGGGGGNSHNAGGAGGGNYTAGGDGGPGWVCNPTAGGLAGISLSSHISASRIFFGGGGGSGEGNNGSATGGGDGGGIILIKASTLRTVGSCGGRDITANGESLTGNSSNDGSGGGGAGGSIILQIDSFSISSSCNLTIESSGGDGGWVNSGAQHGGGGGGGQGVIIFSSTQPTTNVTTTANNGTGGCNNNSNPCTNQASSGSGSNGSGVIDSTSGPLPVTLISFHARFEETHVSLKWETLTEINNDYFLVQRSKDLETWETLEKVQGSGDSRTLRKYHFSDYAPLPGVSYYRLFQVDYDGKFEIFGPLAVTSLEVKSIKIFPNPASNELFISLPHTDGVALIELFDALGNLQMKLKSQSDDNNLLQMDVSNLGSGIYTIRVTIDDKTHRLNFIKE